MTQNVTRIQTDCLPWLLPPMIELRGRLFLLSVHVISCLAAVFGNLLIALAISINRSLQTTTNIFILSLSITDAIVGAMGQPLFVLMLFRGDLASCLLIRTQYWLGSVSTGASGLILCAVSIERYMMICRPFLHMRIFTTKRVIMIVANVWCTSMVLTSTAFSNIPRLVYGSILFTSFFVVLFVILPCYIAIYLTAIKQVRQIERDITNSERHERKRQRRKTWTIMLVAFGFLFCWVIYFINTFIWFLDIYRYNHNSTLVTFYYFGLSLGYINSALNPFLYTFNNRDLKAGILRILHLLQILCRSNQVRATVSLNERTTITSIAGTSRGEQRNFGERTSTLEH